MSKIVEWPIPAADIVANRKPETVEQWLYINNIDNEGDTVLDFCMGSGTTGVACKNLNRDFIGIEKEKQYYDIAKERIDSI